VLNAPSTAEQDYLKQIYLLHEESGRVTTQQLAGRLGVKAPSVTAMLKHLADDTSGPYVRHTPYHGVELTERGQAVALEMVRHHRLIELYLAELLDMPWDRVHEEAERLEHVLSEDLEERMAAKLGQPTRDPHGDPIPTREGALEEVHGAPLASLDVGEGSTVVRVPDGDSALLQYLETLGLVPGAEVRVEAITPYGEVLTVDVGGRHESIGATVAQRVLVGPSQHAMRDEHDPTRQASPANRIR
jgi:DtxR family transcriptional regulator, Mn-dependent transcriptional regulator